MATSVLSPNRVFNAFPDVDMSNNDTFPIAKQLSDIISTYGLSHAVGSCLLHKHFDLNDGEVLLLSRTTVAERDDREILMVAQPKLKVQLNDDDFIPYQFSFCGGRWVPFAYIRKDEVGNEAVASAELLNTEALCNLFQEVGRFAELNGIENKYGLMLRVYRDLQIEGGNVWTLCENTNRKARQQFWVKLLYSDSSVPTLLKTTWGGELAENGITKFDTCTDGCRPDGRDGHVGYHWYMP